MTRPATLTLDVNGTQHTLSADADTPLLYLLRNDLALNGPKFGCGLGECGACTVLLDGVPTRSCVTSARVAEGHAITTLEGLGSRECLHPVQQAFVDEEAAQCGYCLNGMIMTAKALLDRVPEPSLDVIRRELSRNLCRCGTHVEILRAVQRAAVLLREAKVRALPDGTREAEAARLPVMMSGVAGLTRSMTETVGAAHVTDTTRADAAGSSTVASDAACVTVTTVADVRRSRDKTPGAANVTVTTVAEERARSTSAAADTPSAGAPPGAPHGAPR